MSQEIISLINSIFTLVRDYAVVSRCQLLQCNPLLLVHIGHQMS